MNKVKPKTALAKLLDSVSDMNILDGAEDWYCLYR